MSESVLCVLSDVPGHRELLAGNNTGYLYPLERSERVADHLIRHLSQPDESTKRGKASPWPPQDCCWE